MTRGIIIALAFLTSTRAFAEPDKLPDDPSKLDCDWAGCELVTVTDAAKHAIEARKDYTKLVIRVARGTTDAGFATLRKLDWVTRVDVQDVADLTPLAKLSHLEELVVISVTPKSLAPLVKLPALRRLALMTNVGDLDLGPLKAMAKLRDLSIHCETAACIATVGELSSLTTLSITNGFSPLDKAALEPLSKLENLEDLSLMSTGLTDLTLVAKLAKLKTLNLQGNAKLVDIDGLRKLPALDDLTIQNGNGAKNPKVLFELPNLKHLWAQESLLSEKAKAQLKTKRQDLMIQ